MAQRSAGILLFRSVGETAEVLLVHPGGPFWRRKDAGAWMIPKGLIEPGESGVQAAVREFEEELGVPLQCVPFPLCELRQAGGKHVTVYAAEGDLDPSTITSASFTIEWPPRSGKLESFPEVDRARWMDLGQARSLMLPSQIPALDALQERLLA